MRMSGGWRARSRRSSAGVSPVRIAIEMPGSARPAARRQGDAGERGAQVALDVVRQRLQRARRTGRGRCRAVSARRRAVATSRSRHHRNAARVLPLPVGRGSACVPRLIAAQPCAWAGVGASNVASNQARTAGPKGASGSALLRSHGTRIYTCRTISYTCSRCRRDGGEGRTLDTRSANGRHHEPGRGRDRLDRLPRRRAPDPPSASVLTDDEVLRRAGDGRRCEP